MFEAMKDKLYDEGLYYEIAEFVTKHRQGGNPMKFPPPFPRKGGFNYYYRIEHSDEKSAIIRFAHPGFSQIAE